MHKETETDFGRLLLEIAAERNRLSVAADTKQKMTAETKRVWERTMREKKDVLASSGVVDLFEEIRDGGMVVWSNEPYFEMTEVQVEKEILENVNNFFGEWFGLKRRSKIIQTEKVQGEKISDFTPARIELGDDGATVSIYFKEEEKQWERYYVCSYVKVSAMSDGKLVVICGYSRTMVHDYDSLMKELAKAFLNPGIIDNEPDWPDIR